MSNKYIRQIDELGNEIPDSESGRDHLIPYVHMQEERATTSGSKLKKKNGNNYTYLKPAIRSGSSRKKK